MTRIDQKREREKRLIGNDPIRVPPQGLCPSPSGAGASVDVEEEAGAVVAVMRVSSLPFERRLRLPASPIF